MRISPTFPAELKPLHDEHIHAMLSVWGLFDSESENFKKLEAQNHWVPNAHVYDATNPKARDFYWENLVGKLFSQGWDAFWLDSAEPEEYWPHMGDAILQRQATRDRQRGALYQHLSARCTRLASRSTGRRQPTRSAFFCSRGRRFSGSSASGRPSGRVMFTARIGD